MTLEIPTNNFNWFTLECLYYDKTSRMVYCIFVFWNRIGFSWCACAWFYFMFIVNVNVLTGFSTYYINHCKFHFRCLPNLPSVVSHTHFICSHQNLFLHLVYFRRLLTFLSCKMNFDVTVLCLSNKQKFLYLPNSFEWWLESRVTRKVSL